MLVTTTNCLMGKGIKFNCNLKKLQNPNFSLVSPKCCSNERYALSTYYFVSCKQNKSSAVTEVGKLQHHRNVQLDKRRDDSWVRGLLFS